ncbi:MAG TPA: hypothetical protein DCW41_07890 [Clostridiales bacterium]|nr:hypothetical protein [Clostridiales bacterium]
MIFKFEKRFIEFINKHLDILFFVIMLLLSLVIRYVLLGYLSKDFTDFLDPWFDEIKGLGFKKAMVTQVGNYNVPYQILISIMTYIPGISTVTLYKLLSIAFDYLLAFSCALFVKEVIGKDDKRVLSAVFLGVLFLPTVVLNSAAWAQCDSIYVSFIILALIFLYKNKPFWAFLMLGLSFSFKLQVILIIPFFLYMYFSKKNFSILHFLIIPATDVVMCLPAILCGRSVKATLEVYLLQTDYYDQMSMSALNFWQLMGGEGEQFVYLRNYAIIFTAAILGCGLYLFLRNKPAFRESKEAFISIALWTMYATFMFLPAMHDRYSFGIEILFLLLMLLGGKKNTVFFIVSQVMGTVNYAGYLIRTDYDKRAWAVVDLILFLCVTFEYVIKPYKEARKSGNDI